MILPFLAKESIFGIKIFRKYYLHTYKKYGRVVRKALNVELLVFSYLALFSFSLMT